jgi:hypothetical protein
MDHLWRRQRRCRGGRRRRRGGGGEAAEADGSAVVNRDGGEDGNGKDGGVTVAMLVKKTDRTQDLADVKRGEGGTTSVDGEDLTPPQGSGASATTRV